MLEEETSQQYKDFFLDLKPKLVKRVVDGKFMGYKPTYDYNLDTFMDNLLVKLQLELQKQKYFMPSGKDPKYSWGQGD